MTINGILAMAGIAYLIVGIFRIARNHASTMARMDREQWRREGKPWKFIVIPLAVTLLWPLAALLAWRIRKAIKSGEFDRVANQVTQEWAQQGKIKSCHIAGMHEDPDDSKQR